MKLKNDKGVTLIILTITIIVLLIVTGITVYNSKEQLAIKNVNNLYSDIEAISTKVSEYYLKNNTLPVFENNVYINNSTELSMLLKSNGATGDVINPNDDGAYYVINLSKLENLTLNYGREYKNWSDESNFKTYQDLYIINSVTHQIYYPLGIKLGTDVFFSRDLDIETVDEVVNTTISNAGFKLTNIQANKNTVTGSTKIIINADITLSISSEFQKDTLKYGWIVNGNTSDLIFTNFNLDTSNTATLMSKQLDNSTVYSLYIKILDINGEEHIIQKDITIN